MLAQAHNMEAIGYDLGRRRVQDVVSVPDFYATVLHLLGLDHETLTHEFNGLAQRLNNVNGNIPKEVLP